MSATYVRMCQPAGCGSIWREERLRLVVLVEGWSDQAAIETLARRVGLNFAAMGIVVLPIGGAMNARQFAVRFGIYGISRTN